MKLFLTFIVCTAISGCSTLASGSGNTSGHGGRAPANAPDSTEGHAEQTQQKLIDITPLSKFGDGSRTSFERDDNFSDAYTRILVRSGIGEVESNDTIEPSPYKRRPPLARYLVAKYYSINLTAKVTAGAFEATIPLATVAHQSGRKIGEKWEREIHHSRHDFPLFLVSNSGTTSNPTIKFLVSGDNTLESSAATVALQVALGVAKATASTSPVLTSINEGEVANQARAVDAAISRLFSSSLSETHWASKDLRYWHDSSRNPIGTSITFSIPRESKDWNSSPMTVGTWTITFDHPRPSIFSEWKICDDATRPKCAKTKVDARHLVAMEIVPAQVLGYRISPAQGDAGTIRSFIAQKPWFNSGTNELARSQKSLVPATSICRSIIDDMTSLGLSSFDADVIVWAVAKGMELPEGVALDSAPGCSDSIQRFIAARDYSENN